MHELFYVYIFLTFLIKKQEFLMFAVKNMKFYDLE